MELDATGEGTAASPIVPGHAIVGGFEYGISDTITRPANTTVYTGGAKLVIGETTPKVLTFANTSRANGGTGQILAAKLNTNDLVPRNLWIRLWLYSVSPTALADRSQWPLLADASRFGFVDFTDFQSGGTGSDRSESFGVITGGMFRCAANSRDIYGVPVFICDSDYAPLSSQIFQFTFTGVEQR